MSGATPPPGSPPRFAWLREKRRGDLAAVRAALRAGQLDAYARAELAEVLNDLAGDGGLSTRQRARLAEVIAAIDAADAADPAFRPIRLDRPAHQTPGPRAI